MGGINPVLAALGQQLQQQPLPPDSSIPPPPEVGNLPMAGGQSLQSPPQQAYQPPQQLPTDAEGQIPQLSTRQQSAPSPQQNPTQQYQNYLGQQVAQNTQLAGNPSGVKALLGNFLHSGLGVLMNHVGIMTPEQKAQNAQIQLQGIQHNQLLTQLTQAQIDQAKANATMVDVPMPDGNTVQMPVTSAKTVIAAQASPR